MRRRRDTHHHTKEKAHELTAEYFTIHPRTLRPTSDDYSKAASTEMMRLNEKLDEDSDIEKMEIADIGSLIHVLKRATVDREKLVAVRKFMSSGSEELYYLSSRMPEIMGLLVFQSSRRQLLTDLLNRFDDAHNRRESLVDHKHDDEDAQKEHDIAARNAENLMKAVKAADEQVKKLEYWSDIKGMSQRGETLQQSPEGKWDLSKWQGLSPTGEEKHPEDSFASKQAASEGVQQLHKHPEHGTAESERTSKKSSVWFDTKQSTKESSRDTGQREYSTAAESASELPRKGGKARASNLDGTDETDEDASTLESAPEDKSNKDAPATQPVHIPSAPSKQSVQIVEPIPEAAERILRDVGGDDS